MTTMRAAMVHLHDVLDAYVPKTMEEAARLRFNTPEGPSAIGRATVAVLSSATTSSASTVPVAEGAAARERAAFMGHAFRENYIAVLRPQAAQDPIYRLMHEIQLGKLMPVVLFELHGRDESDSSPLLALLDGCTQILRRAAPNLQQPQTAESSLVLGELLGAVAQVCGLALAAKARPSAGRLQALQAAWQPFMGKLPQQLFQDQGAKRAAEHSIRRAVRKLQRLQQAQLLGA